MSAAGKQLGQWESEVALEARRLHDETQHKTLPREVKFVKEYLTAFEGITFCVPRIVPADNDLWTPGFPASISIDVGLTQSAFSAFPILRTVVLRWSVRATAETSLERHRLA